MEKLSDKDKNMIIVALLGYSNDDYNGLGYKLINNSFDVIIHERSK